MADSDNANPYKSPEAEEETLAPSAEVIKDSRYLVTPPKSTLPPRCVYCNQPATDSHALGDYYWFTWWGLRSAEIKCYLCTGHNQRIKRQQRWYSYVGWAWLAYFSIGFLARELFPQASQELRAIQPWAGLLIAASYAGLRAYIAFSGSTLKLPKVVRANSQSAYVANLGKPFLDTLADGADGLRVEQRLPSQEE